MRPPRAGGLSRWCARSADVNISTNSPVSAKALRAHRTRSAPPAQRSATEHAQSDLQRRLAEEAELVPCPKCWWINDELVAGYRRGIYRGATKLALGLGIVGTLVSLAAGWFISLGPVADRGALPYALIGGPAISITLAAAIVVVRYLLSACVRPNRNYPQAPRLPRGSPVPLIKNRTTGELEPARATSGPEPEIDSSFGTGAWMDFQVGRNTLPPICCECLAPSAPGREYRRPVRPAVDVVVPLCAPAPAAGRAASGSAPEPRSP